MMLPALPGNPEDRDQLVVAEPQREAVVTRESSGVMVHVMEPVASPTIAGGGLRAHVTTDRLLDLIPGAGVAGTWTLTPLSWRVTVPAALDDVIEWSPALALGGDGAAALDLAVVINGTVVRYLSTGTSTPSALGHAGLYATGGYGAARLTQIRHRVMLGELSGGTITLALAYRADPDGEMTLGHAQLASTFSALNLGPTTGVPGVEDPESDWYTKIYIGTGDPEVVPQNYRRVRALGIDTAEMTFYELDE